MKFWTPEKVETLKIHWKAGASARAIGVMLGGGRNAVIGKANRLGLPPHAASHRHLDAAKKRALKKRAVKSRLVRGRRGRPRTTPQGAPLPPAPPPPPPPEARPVRFADLVNYHCLYPVTEGPPFLFCGQIRQVKSVYCAVHHALCYVKPRYDEARQREWRQPRGSDFAIMRGRAA